MTETNPFYSHALYLDLELTCWDCTPPPGMQQEIIEIGVVQMDLATLAISAEATYFVRPRRWEISPKCHEMTGITPQDIVTARMLPEIVPLLEQQFSPAGRLCCAWGQDFPILAKACANHGIESPFRKVLDLLELFRTAFILKQQPSVTRAAEMLGLSFEGVAHSALVDARNTAYVHAAMLRRLREASSAPFDLPAIAAPSDETTMPQPLSPFAQALASSLRGSQSE